jgi:hypothetical protein
LTYYRKLEGYKVVRRFGTDLDGPSLSFERRFCSTMTVIKTYQTRIEADLAGVALRAAGIDFTVVGVGVAMEGGAASVRLLVPDEQAQAAREVLGTA